MRVLGIMGSPRKNGNTAFLLSRFMETAGSLGAQTDVISITDWEIRPCMEYTTCEKTGSCPIRDQIESEIFPKLWAADLVVMATPMFFYSAPAQLKALIDRSQPLWARKYRLDLTDPGRPHRKGFLLALGATRGKKLFDGIDMTARYFYDAMGAEYMGMLNYRSVENPGDMAAHPTVEADVEGMAAELLSSFRERRPVWFVCADGRLLSPMAAAFTRFAAGDLLDVRYAGIETRADGLHPGLNPAMAEDGIDTGFQSCCSVSGLPEKKEGTVVIAIGTSESEFSGFPHDRFWPVAESPDSEDACGSIRDGIAEKVSDLVAELTGRE